VPAESRPAADARVAAARFANANNREALLVESARATRTLVASLTHSLNSSLQVLGDALFAVREDTQAILDASDRSARPSGTLVHESLRLANDAADRLAAIGFTLPSLVVDPAVNCGPISLHAELTGLVALTWHHWHRRAAVLVEVDSAATPFHCEWWIVRLAMQHLLLWATAPNARQENSARPVSRTVRIHAAMRGDSVEIYVRLAAEPDDAFVAPKFAPTIRSVVDGCAAALSGSFSATERDDGVAETLLCFPTHANAKAMR
jgi:hypothetical protein